MSYRIDAVKCTSCDACRLQCPRNAIAIAFKEKTYVIDASLCNECANVSSIRCVSHCPESAILIETSQAA